MIALGRPLCLRKRIARENSVFAIEVHFDDFVDHVLRVRQMLQYESKQFSLQHGQYLRDNDHQARMHLFFGVQLPEVAGIVRYERKILFDDPRHQVPVGFAAQPQPVHMKQSWPCA